MIPSQKYRIFFISIQKIMRLISGQKHENIKNQCYFRVETDQFFLLLRTENENKAYQIVQNFYFSSQKFKKNILSFIYVFS